MKTGRKLHTLDNRFRCMSICGYSIFRRPRNHRNKKNIVTYREEFKSSGIPFKSEGSINSVVDSWDDLYISDCLENPLSWKTHYKIKRQWMKNIK